MKEQRQAVATRRDFALGLGLVWGASGQASPRGAGKGRVTQVGGLVGERLGRAVERYLKPFRIEAWLEMLERREYREWWWTGEQPGKWLHAAMLAAEMCEDAGLREQARAALKRMIGAQEETGYLGITAASLRTARRPLRGMDAYELYFTLHALCAAHEMFAEAGALEAARRLGDYFAQRIGPGKAEFYPLPRPVTLAGHEVHYGLEGALLIDPMMRLYEATGEARYLKWVEWVVGSLDRWSNCDNFSNLDKVAAGTMALGEIQPYVHAHTLHMVLLGVLRLYQATGRRELLGKAQGVWRAVMANYRYITGGVSTGEHYGAPHDLPNTGQVVETCASLSWTLLNQRLLELTGEAAHADAIERLMFNHALAAQTVDGEGFRYHCPLNGWKPAAAWTGPDCCSSSGHLMLAQLPGTFYGQSGAGISVHQYVPSVYETEVGGVRVRIAQRHNYPAEETVGMEVTTGAPARFALRLRVPGWCEGAELTVQGERVVVKAGGYAVVEREWRGGERVVLRLPMRVGWMQGEHGNAGLHALTRGPLVYCLDAAWMEVEAGERLAGDRQGDNLPGVSGVEEELMVAAAPPGAYGPAYGVRVRLKDGGTMTAGMVAYANLGRWYRTAEEKEKGPRFHPEQAGPAKQAASQERRMPYAVWLRRA